jgi:hypothetical protein
VCRRGGRLRHVLLRNGSAGHESGSKAADLSKRLVGPVGIEPTTYGLEERPKPVRKVGNSSFRA